MLLFRSTTPIWRHLSRSITVSASIVIRAVVSAAIFGRTRAKENGDPGVSRDGDEGFEDGVGLVVVLLQVAVAVAQADDEEFRAVVDDARIRTRGLETDADDGVRRVRLGVDLQRFRAGVALGDGVEPVAEAFDPMTDSEYSVRYSAAVLSSLQQAAASTPQTRMKRIFFIVGF